ncbi:MAG: glycogen debranching enzyme family protein [Oligoflexia bacterium]|nr:glycogen debranching enzyme family protein [Oligoflexia bacterium]
MNDIANGRENETLRIPWSEENNNTNAEELVKLEWLVTNGLGGYASGTLAGVASRRYHGLLVASLTDPFGRWMMLNHLTELIRLPNGNSYLIGGEELQGKLILHSTNHLKEFRLEMGLPVWRYEFEGYVIEKRILLSHRQNSVYISYRLLEGNGIIRIKIRPSVNFRPHDSPVNTINRSTLTVSCTEGRIELMETLAKLPSLRLYIYGEQNAFTLKSAWPPAVFYRMEESRGHESVGEMWTPGYFRADLSMAEEVTFVASTESWDIIQSLLPQEAFDLEITRRERLRDIAHPAVKKGAISELILAADQFLITPAGRTIHEARTRAAGDEGRTVIAGYHWFTDWGRDTMISLEGLTLITGRYIEAGHILRTFSHYIQDGLIPNFFPDGQNEGLYHTADATLWFFHSLNRYFLLTNDHITLRQILPKLLDIIDHHLRGTKFGIGIDIKDGLLTQGEQGYQLTWMDAKVGNWVVTPRRGKAVEINALWYNALRLLQHWLQQQDLLEDELKNEKIIARAQEIGALADKVYRSFNERFWNSSKNFLYDVVDGENGDDDALRPNQLFAISLDYPVLAKTRWPAVLSAVSEKLLTPFGLRSLTPDHPDYKSLYFGDVRARDAAYHQGTVWAWLIGAYIDAWLATYPERKSEARNYLKGLVKHLGEHCIGTISEIFDGEPPFTPRGCVAQAWSVAEVLRSWVRTSFEE